MLRLGAPRVPAFPLLALSAGWSAAVHACVCSFLPSFAASAAPAAPVALALAALHLPALVLHPFLRAFPPRRPARALALALAFDVVATLLVARAAALPNTVPTSHRPYPFPALLAAAMLIAGVAAMLTQSQTIMHISAHIPPAQFQRDLGIHLSFVEGFAALFAALVPPFGALLLASTRARAYIPFAILAAIQLAQLPFSTAKLVQKSSRDTAQLGEVDASLIPEYLPDSGDFDSVARFVAQRSTWLPMLVMFTAVASTVVLRPVLATHLFFEERKSLLAPALRFSVMSICAVLADTAVTAMDFTQMGRNPVIICGLGLASVGFRVLQNPAYLDLGVVLVALGSNAALVLTLGHLADESGIEGLGQHDVATFLAFMVFAAGEATGIIASGVIRDCLGSFAASMLVWSKLVLLVVVVMVLERVVFVARYVLGYHAFSGLDQRVEYRPANESQPLLG